MERVAASTDQMDIIVFVHMEKVDVGARKVLLSFLT